MVELERVYVVKLITGEIFFAEFIAQDKEKIVIKNALSVEYSELEDGRIGVGFREWGSYADKRELCLKQIHVLYCEPAAKDFAELYAKQFNKVVIPQKGGIITP